MQNFETIISDFINNMGILAPIISSILIVLEAIFAFLPLALFVTINFYYFGTILGFLISWVLTCLGGYIVFIFWRHVVKDRLDKKLSKKDSKVKKLKDKIDDLSLEKFALLFAIPFAPSFFINMVAGLSNISKKKFIIALAIGKVFVIYFWGFIGTNLIDSFNNPYNLIKIAILMLAAFIISKLVKKAFGIK